MPKDEFDFGDPLELNGVGVPCAEDTTGTMTECVVEEFVRLGYNHKQILALFRSPLYLGPHLALRHRGEPFVRDKICEVFARWGKPVDRATGFPPAGDSPESARPSGAEDDRAGRAGASGLTDPTGAPAPDLLL